MLAAATHTSAASAGPQLHLRQTPAPTKRFCSAQPDHLGSSVSLDVEETPRYNCGQIKLCGPGRVCLPSPESKSGLTCRTFLYAQHERCQEPHLARCWGAAGAGCCAGTGKLEPSWQQDRQGTALSSVVRATGTWEWSRSGTDQRSTQVPQ